jgi:hypothetical protein
MVSYLGTGYSFGIHRLAETFYEKAKLPRPVHILLVSDYDMFQILNAEVAGQVGWDVAREAVRRCKGGGTYVLQLPGYPVSTGTTYGPLIERMQQDGWNVHLVNSMDELLAFAKQFSRARYHHRGTQP